MATEKISLTLDESLLAAARARVGPRGLSRYLNRALRHLLQRDRLAGFLEELEQREGPIDATVMSEVRQAWPSAEDEVRARSASSLTPGP